MGQTAAVSSVRVFGDGDRFEVVGRVGSGGMGVVYKVLDRDRGVHLALKRLHVPAPEDVLRFKTEFRALRDFDHPNLLRLGQLFENEGEWFFTMELVEGGDFLRYVRRARAASDGGGETNDSHATRTGSGADLAATTAPSMHLPSEAGLTVATGVLAAHRQADERAPSASGQRVVAGVAARFDEARLRAGLAQLTLALDALHHAGIVHRDVKPSNVLVDGTGRVVLLDFGVVAELGRLSVDQDGSIVGTASYMSPEQACGEQVGPPSDWYAVGTMLYEVLTGQPPFTGATADVLTRKLLDEITAPRDLDAGTPADLSALCMRMLARDAEARPSALEILGVLGVSDAAAMLAASKRARRAVFVGRARELAELGEAFADVRAGRAVTVFVEGASGIGKSATVGRAIDAFRASDPRVVVLRGRCHENETVPYNAFDGVIDDLTRALRNLPPRAASIPRCAELLELFPALGSVASLSALAATDPPMELAAVERKRMAVDQLRALLASVAAERPVVVLADDVHWADAESLWLLAEWTRDPAPHLLLLATARPAADGAPCAAVAAAAGDVRSLRLVGLPAADARQLLAGLLAEASPERAADVDRLLSEGAGHPMFLGELVQYAADHDGDCVIQLDAALLARVDRMPPLAIRALEAVASAGVPLGEAALARVLKVARTALAPQLSVLRSARLVRAAGAVQGNVLEPFHDRVREAVYGRMESGARRALHLRLGRILARGGAPPEILLGHYEKGGDVVRAAEHALAAATRAESGLAFDRAAALYAYAARAGGHAVDRERQLRTRVAEMLQKAGRPRDAAEAFEAAAAVGVPPRDEAFDLRRRAAEQYLMGGYLKEGVAASSVLLAEIGESRPDRFIFLFLIGLVALIRIKLARFAWTSRAEESVPAEREKQLDVYWTLGAGLAFLDSLRAATFTLRGAMLSVRHGDDRRIARMTCAAGIGMSSQGDGACAARLLEATRLAAARAGTDLARFYAELSDVGYTFMIGNDCRLTVEKAVRARALWSHLGQRGGWESDVAEQFQIWALLSLGEYQRMADEVTEAVRFARASGNRFRECMLRASSPQGHMLGDVPDEGRADVCDAVKSWAEAGGRFATPDYWSLKSRCQLAFYSGRLEDLEPLDEEWARFDRSGLGMMKLLRMESTELRASTALRRAAHAKARGDAAGLRRHVAEARRMMKRLVRKEGPFAEGSYVRNLPALALLERGPDAARPLFDEALRFAEGQGWAGFAAGARYSLGHLIGGDEGRAHLASARAWAVRVEAKQPERLVAMMSPVSALFVSSRTP
jgi:serine/threonine protein kinase